jgi:hypothetical protein
MCRFIFLYHTPKKSVSIIEGGEIEEPLKKHQKTPVDAMKPK